MGLLLALSGGEPSDRLAAGQIDPNRVVQPRLVRGLTLQTINAALSDAVRQLIIDNARIIPGIDLRQIFRIGTEP